MHDYALALRAELETLLDNVDPSDNLYIDVLDPEENGKPTMDEILEWAVWAVVAINAHIEAGNSVPRDKGGSQ